MTGGPYGRPAVAQGDGGLHLPCPGNSSRTNSGNAGNEVCSPGSKLNTISLPKPTSVPFSFFSGFNENLQLEIGRGDVEALLAECWQPATSSRDSRWQREQEEPETAVAGLSSDQSIGMLENSLLESEVSISSLSQIGHSRASPWDPMLWLDVRQRLIDAGNFKELPNLMRSVRQSSARALQLQEYQIPGSNGAPQTVRLSEHLSSPHCVRWFGRRNVTIPHAMQQANHDAIEPPIIVVADSPLDVIWRLSQSGGATARAGDAQRPICMVVEASATDFDSRGVLNLSGSKGTSMTLQNMLVRTDFERFAHQAENLLQSGRSTIKDHLTAKHDPYVFSCPGVTMYRGSREAGYPYLEKPASFTSIVSAMPSMRPGVTTATNGMGPKTEWYAADTDQTALLERLSLIGFAALQQTDPDTKGILVLNALGCTDRGLHPKDAVANSLKHWRTRFARLFHTVFLACGSDSELAENFDLGINRQLYGALVSEDVTGMTDWHWSEHHISMHVNCIDMMSVASLVEEEQERQAAKKRMEDEQARKEEDVKKWLQDEQANELRERQAMCKEDGLDETLQHVLDKHLELLLATERLQAENASKSEVLPSSLGARPSATASPFASDQASELVDSVQMKVVASPRPSILKRGNSESGRSLSVMSVSYMDDFSGAMEESKQRRVQSTIQEKQAERIIQEGSLGGIGGGASRKSVVIKRMSLKGRNSLTATGMMSPCVSEGRSRTNSCQSIASIRGVQELDDMGRQISSGSGTRASRAESPPSHSGSDDSVKTVASNAGHRTSMFNIVRGRGSYKNGSIVSNSVGQAMFGHVANATFQSARSAPSKDRELTKAERQEQVRAEARKTLMQRGVSTDSLQHDIVISPPTKSKLRQTLEEQALKASIEGEFDESEFDTASIRCPSSVSTPSTLMSRNSSWSEPPGTYAADGRDSIVSASQDAERRPSLQSPRVSTGSGLARGSSFKSTKRSSLSSLREHDEELLSPCSSGELSANSSRSPSKTPQGAHLEVNVCQDGEHGQLAADSRIQLKAQALKQKNDLEEAAKLEAAAGFTVEIPPSASARTSFCGAPVVVEERQVRMNLQQLVDDFKRSTEVFWNSPRRKKMTRARVPLRRGSNEVRGDAIQKAMVAGNWQDLQTHTKTYMAEEDRNADLEPSFTRAVLSDLRSFSTTGSVRGIYGRSTTMPAHAITQDDDKKSDAMLQAPQQMTLKEMRRISVQNQQKERRASLEKKGSRRNSRESKEHGKSDEESPKRQTLPPLSDIRSGQLSARLASPAASPPNSPSNSTGSTTSPHSCKRGSTLGAAAAGFEHGLADITNPSENMFL